MAEFFQFGEKNKTTNRSILLHDIINNQHLNTVLWYLTFHKSKTEYASMLKEKCKEYAFLSF